MMRNLTVALCLTLLFACGSKPLRFEPPGIKLVDLTFVPDAAEFELRVRLSNPVPRSMPIGAVRFEVSVDGESLGEFVPEFKGELASLGEEVLTVSGRGNPAALAVLGRLNAGEMTRLPLNIDGKVSSPSGDSFDLRRDGWLSPMPGRPWSFR